MLRHLFTIVPSIILGAGIVVLMAPKETYTKIVYDNSNYKHLYQAVAGVGHRQKALLELLNLRGVLSTDDVTAVRQMRGQY